MPIEWSNNKIAVRTWELIPRFFTDMNHLSVTIYRDKENTYGIRKLQSGGNGRELLIDFDSLEEHIKKALGDPRRVLSWMDKYYSIDDVAGSYYAQFRFENGNGLGAEHCEEYTINASTLRAAMLLKQARERERLTKGGSLRGVATSIWNDTIEFRTVQKMKYGKVHTLPNNERRFLETLKKFNEQGYKALISKKHNNKNAVKVTADVIELLNNLFAGTILKPSPTEIAREYTRFLLKDVDVVINETGEVIDPVGYPDLSDTAILGYLSKWENRIGTHGKRSGDRQKLMNNYKVTHRFKPSEMAGSILSVDDRNPPFIMEDNKRVWFYIGIDLASEAWTTWVYGRTKEGIIEDFYQQLVRDYAKYGVGLPLELECESSLNSGLRESVLRDGVLFKKVRIEKNNSTGKKIEQYFGRIRYGLEKKIEGWRGRPFARKEANQVQTEKPMIKKFGQIVEDTIAAMEEWNLQPHPVYPDKTRWEVFMENQNPKCKPINWDMVLPAIGKKTKTSCKVGFVNLNGIEWCLGDAGKLATGEKLINIMRNVEGKTFVVRWLDDEDGKVIKAFAYINDRYVCELVDVPMYRKAYYERDETDFMNQNLFSAYSNTVYQFGKQRKKSISQVTILERNVSSEQPRTVEVLAMPTEEEEIALKTRVAKPSIWDRF